LKTIGPTTTADTVGKRGIESKAVNLPYPNVEVAWRYVIAMLERLVVALWKLRCYNGLDPSLWLLPCRTMMPCNIAAFEGYVHFDVLGSMNAIG
jgi:hypothetical protein